MNNFILKNKINFAILLSLALLTGCGANDDTNVTVPSNVDTPTSSATSSDVVEIPNETENVETNTETNIETNVDIDVSQVSDIYELFPVGRMVNKTLTELTSEYEVKSTPTSDGYTKHLINFSQDDIVDESVTDEEFVVVLTDENDIVTLVTYTEMSTLGSEYDTLIKSTVDTQNDIYNILLNQGDELDLVITDMPVKEEGNIPKLVEDYTNNPEFSGGNYESRFNVENIEIETGIAYMLELSDKSGLYIKTLTFENYESNG